jgi:hypothetical protein
MIIDLTIASFDILANSYFRSENKDTILLLRSFLVNKLPLLLGSLSINLAITFPALNAEMCISQALGNIDLSTFPAPSSMFDQIADNSGAQLSDVRQEFLFSCCLHGLIAESSIDALLGETSLANLPMGGRYAKADIVSQCSADSTRAEELIREIELMEGNSGAICSAITEVMRNLAKTKDTSTLRSICSALSRKPRCMDVMLLFERPGTILGPLCELLDEWRYDDDQTEYQMVYEEFGMILLLVLAYIRRFNLSIADLTSDGYAPAANSFMTQMLQDYSRSHSMEDLTVDQRSHLGDWIKDLYEAEGISDELLQGCTPQEFYRLVPTLFHQTLLAVTTRTIDFDVLKGGLEYLFGIMLITSLIPAIGFLSSYLWKHQNPARHKDIANSIIKTLTSIIRPPSELISGEAESIHFTVLNITAKDLELVLRSLRHHDPSRNDIEPLLQKLQPHLSFPRNEGASPSELDSWCSHHSSVGGAAKSQALSGPVTSSLTQSLRNVFQGQVAWSLIPHIAFASPSAYTHRLVITACQLLGADTVLDIFASETRALIATAESETAVAATAAVMSVDGQNDTNANAARARDAADAAVDLTVNLVIGLTSGKEFEARRQVIMSVVHATPQIDVLSARKEYEGSFLTLVEALHLAVQPSTIEAKSININAIDRNSSSEKEEEKRATIKLLKRINAITHLYLVAPHTNPIPVIPHDASILTGAGKTIVTAAEVGDTTAAATATDGDQALQDLGLDLSANNNEDITNSAAANAAATIAATANDPSGMDFEFDNFGMDLNMTGNDGGMNNMGSNMNSMGVGGDDGLGGLDLNMDLGDMDLSALGDMGEMDLGDLGFGDMGTEGS